MIHGDDDDDDDDADADADAGGGGGGGGICVISIGFVPYRGGGGWEGKTHVLFSDGID